MAVHTHSLLGVVALRGRPNILLASEIFEIHFWDLFDPENRAYSRRAVGAAAAVCELFVLRQSCARIGVKLTTQLFPRPPAQDH